MNIVARRKLLKKRTERRFPGRPLGWIGGKLYFLDSQEEVPGVKQLPKGAKAVGLAAQAPRKIQPARPKSLHRPSRFGSDSRTRAWGF